jgi:hypothetical protein
MKLTSFHLKIIALSTMTIDHFGVIVIYPLLTTFSGPLYTFYLMLRIIGRLAFPLFAFMLVEAVIHTRNAKRYLLQLGSMALIIGVAIFLLNQQGFSIAAGNIFIDLFFAALTLVLLHQKRWYFYPLALLSALFVVASEWYGFPNAYGADYGIYGLTLIFVFYIARRLTQYVFEHPGTKVNIFIYLFFPAGLKLFTLSSAGLFIVNFLWYILYLVSANQALAFIGIQSYSVVAGLFIALYTGTLGFQPKWFKRFSYLYYPLHFIVLFVLYSIIVAII